LVAGRVTMGGANKRPTNESLRLVGGAGGVEEAEKPPTSLSDSLMVTLVGGRVGGAGGVGGNRFRWSYWLAWVE
jgi:hypothetical protein